MIEDDAKNSAPAKAKDDADRNKKNLDEGLEESFPGSDAPSSTKRSSKGDAERKKEKEDPSEQPS